MFVDQKEKPTFQIRPLILLINNNQECNFIPEVLESFKM